MVGGGIQVPNSKQVALVYLLILHVALRRQRPQSLVVWALSHTPPSLPGASLERSWGGVAPSAELCQGPEGPAEVLSSGKAGGLSVGETEAQIRPR